MLLTIDIIINNNDIVVINNDRLYKRRNGARVFTVLLNGNEEHIELFVGKLLSLEDVNSAGNKKTFFSYFGELNPPIEMKSTYSKILCV